MHTTGLTVTPRTLAGVAAPIALLVILACGGGDKAAGPGGVSVVEISSPGASLQVGATVALTVRYFDAAHTQLSGKSVTFSSSNMAVATVSSVGVVTGVTAGSVTITAAVEGTGGTISLTVVPVPVASIVITPAKPVVREGDSITLTGQPVDAVGRPLAGHTVIWSTANPAMATVDGSGVVTGITPGSVYIRAEADAKRDSVSLRVKSLNAPVITASDPALLVPGITGTVTGINFGATPNDNEVLVNGVSAVVTAALPTSVSFTVPAAIALPCTPAGPVPVSLVANADTATVAMQLQMATPRTLALGESLLLTGQADLSCNEFAATGGRYLITAFNYATNGGVRTSFELLGASTAPAAVQAAATGARLDQPAPAPTGARLALPTATLVPAFEDPLTRHLRAHLVFRQQDQQMASRLGNPRLRDRMRQKAAQPNVAAAVNPPPAVGDMMTYRMPRSLGNYSTYDDVQFRVVYVGAKLIIFEDAGAPLAHTMDTEYQRMGQEFDQVTWPILQNFGNPLVVDSALDNNGHLIALFSPRVNNYTVAGLSNQVLGYVTLCDFFTRAECPASNEAEAFYALVPNPDGGGYSISTWRRYMRSTLAHESKHITSYAERYYRDADVSQLEETWLEEATAQASSEIWARQMYHHQEFDDIGWADGPLCDYAPESATCPDPAEGILHHFGFLYDHYDALETKSILDDPTGVEDPVIYGSSWSFVRWIADTYGPDEGTFFRSIVQVKNDHGVPNIESKTGRPFSELLGLWSLASLADNYPGGTVNDPRLKLRSWNSRDLFAEMSANLTYVGGGTPFPKPWPLAYREVNFGTFSSSQQMVSQLRGGGFAAWDLSGVEAAPQVLAIRNVNGGLAPALIGMAIVRVQ
jgi:Bacterial Ig-like domain (group 2)